MKPHCCFHTEELPSGEDENGMNRSSHRRGSLKNQASGPQVFSSEYCKTFKNTYFEKHLRTAASE